MKSEHKCNVCDKIFNTKPYLSQHKKTHFTSTIECHICNEEFSTKADVSNHVVQVHNYINPKLICKYCQKKFSSVQNVTTHSKKCQAKEEITSVED